MSENDFNIEDDGRYYTELAAAFVRGRIGGADEPSPEELIRLGKARGLRARARVREYLRSKRSFIWNATNISRQLREHCISLCAAYNARVRIIYVETGAASLAEQNRSRERVVPPEIINRLLARWEPPDLTEAHQVEVIVR